MVFRYELDAHCCRSLARNVVHELTRIQITRGRGMCGRGIKEFQIGDFRFQTDDENLKLRPEKPGFEILVSAIILEEIRRPDFIRAWQERSYPRNEILFRAAQSNADVFAKICSEWSAMNWVRSIILAFGLVCSMKGLDAYYVKAQPLTKAMDGT